MPRLPMEAPVVVFAFFVLLFGFLGFSNQNYSLVIAAVSLAGLLMLLYYYLLTHYQYPHRYSYPRRVFNAKWRPLQFMAAFVLSIVSSLLLGAALFAAIGMATVLVQMVSFFVLLIIYHVLIGKWTQARPLITSEISMRSGERNGGIRSRTNYGSSTEGHVITVKYAAPCIRCSRMILKGEIANWQKGVGIWHENCP
jgi:hypothetical protein